MAKYLLLDLYFNKIYQNYLIVKASHLPQRLIFIYIIYSFKTSLMYHIKKS
jgi:hypothetical protein